MFHIFHGADANEQRSAVWLYVSLSQMNCEWFFHTQMNLPGTFWLLFGKSTGTRFFSNQNKGD